MCALHQGTEYPMSQPIFDSRDKRYKTPYGAVAAGTRVEFRLRPER